MVNFKFLMLLSVRFCPALSESFVTGVQMQTNVITSFGTTACDLLKAKAQGLWTDGTFQSCLDLTTLTVAQNIYVIVFRIVVVSEKLKDYSEDMQYFAKAALVNLLLNNEHNVCHTITGTEWMEPVHTIAIAISDIGSHDGINVCNWFVDNYKLAIRSGPFYNCSYQVDLAYRNAIILNLDIRKSLDGIPLDSMNDAEIAWRTESLFNFNIAECIYYDPEDLYLVFQKGIQKEYYEMYLSGPLVEDACEKSSEIPWKQEIKQA